MIENDYNRSKSILPSIWPGVDLAKGPGHGLHGSTRKKLKKNIWNFNISYEKIKKQFIWI
jgi:hypothetical protein